MNNAMNLSPVRAGIDLRGDYERQLEQAIEQRRAYAAEQLEKERSRRRIDYSLVMGDAA